MVSGHGSDRAIRPNSMRISWFRSPSSTPAGSSDSMAALVAQVARRHEVTAVDADAAHDMVWRWHRGLVDLPVYELDGTGSDAFIWPYLVRYPGLTLVLDRKYGAGHATDLLRRRRRDDLDAEDRFSGNHAWRSLAVPLVSSRAVALPGRGMPGGMTDDPPPHLLTFAPAMPCPVVARTPHEGAVRLGLIAPDQRSRDLIAHAAVHVHDAGLALDVLMADTADEVYAGADVLLSMPWPPSGRIAGEVLAAMALGIPSLVVETVDTAGWPTFDPQSWQPREGGPGAPPPVGISIDPRDEEHSLLLALRRLAADATLLPRLSAAAREHWAAVHAPEASAAAFERVLDVASRREPPAHPPDWPAHFTADASGTARRILDEFGFQTDALA